MSLSLRDTLILHSQNHLSPGIKCRKKGGFSMVIHVVQPGDSLYRIAQLHSVPLPFLIQQNELHEPYRLTPGQTIVVPQPEKTYIVRRGDTLGSIAAQNGTTVMQLWQNNPQLGGTDRIQPGQMLVLSYGNKLGRFAVNGYAIRASTCAFCAAHCPI